MYRDKLKAVCIFLAGTFFALLLLFTCSTTADNVINALDVLFDNTGTSLSATNTQDAIVELDTNTKSVEAKALPKIKDGNDHELGVLAGSDSVQQIYVYNQDAEGMLRINIDGDVDSGALYYTTADCTGTAYMTEIMQIFKIDGQLFRSNSGSKATIEYNSIKPDGVSCNTTSNTRTLYEAVNISSFFNLPIVGPYQIVK